MEPPDVLDEQEQEAHVQYAVPLLYAALVSMPGWITGLRPDDCRLITPHHTFTLPLLSQPSMPGRPSLLSIINQAKLPSSVYGNECIRAIIQVRALESSTNWPLAAVAAVAPCCPVLCLSDFPHSPLNADDRAQVQWDIYASQHLMRQLVAYVLLLAAFTAFTLLLPDALHLKEG